MQFEQYRSLKGWSLDQAAEALRRGGDERFALITSSLVSKHERGIHFPSPELIERYAQITDSAVTYQDWAALRKQGRQEPRRRGRPSTAVSV